MDDLFLKEEPRKPKEALYASDFGKMGLDIFFALRGEPKTNPMEWYNHLRMAAGKAAEEVILQAMKDSGKVAVEYNQDTDGYVDTTICGVPVHGYIDAWHIEGFPVEIKTINNANDFDIKRYQSGEPRANYVGQLATYMHAKKVDNGWLCVVSIDGLHRFLFRVRKTAPGIYEAGNTQINLKQEYERLAKVFNLAKENNLTDELLFEKKYKIPIDDVDWRSLSKSKISNARNGRAVVGDWEVQYSPWKNKIIELQGTNLGYSEKELERIRELTNGYTTW